MSRSGDLVTLAIVAGAASLVAVASRYSVTPFDAIFDSAARKRGQDPDMLRAIAHHETGGSFKLDLISPANRNGSRDYGLMQINDRTATALGVDPHSLLNNAQLSIETASKLLDLLKRELGRIFSPQTWVAAYNAGAPAIRTRGVFNVAYVASVMFHWQAYKLRRVVP